MGGAASAFRPERVMSPQEFEVLTPSMRSRFRKEGNALMETNATDLEIHLQLTLFYARLMEELKTREYDAAAKKARELRAKRTADLAAAAEERNSAVWNCDSAAKDKMERRRALHSMFSDRAKGELSTLQASCSQASSSRPSNEETPGDVWSDNRLETPAAVSAYACNLCKKNFTFQWQLSMHNSHSQIHAVNLAEKEESFAAALKKSSQIFSLVKSGVAIFAAPSSAKHRASDEEASVPRLRWRAAVARIIQRQTYERYTAFLAECQAQRGQTSTGAADESSDVVCLYQGTKFFWRSKQQLGVNIFYHTKFNAVEVITQRFVRDAVGLPAPLPADKIDRIYLAYSLLLAQTASKKRHLIEVDEWERSSRGRFEKTRCGPEAAGAFSNKAITEYVLDGLCLAADSDPSCREHGGGDVWFGWSSPADNPIHSYCTGTLTTQECTNPSMPRPVGLTQAQIDVVHLHQLWQVEQAMSAVATSSEELSVSVRRAERLSSVLEDTVKELAFRIKKGQEHVKNNNSPSTNKTFRKFGSRLIRVVQVAKVEAKIRGMEEKIAAEGAKSNPPSPTCLYKTDSTNSGGSDHVALPWVQIRPSRRGNVSPLDPSLGGFQ
jgi:hypothetical protein